MNLVCGKLLALSIKIKVKIKINSLRRTRNLNLMMLQRNERLSHTKSVLKRIRSSRNVITMTTRVTSLMSELSGST